MHRRLCICHKNITSAPLLGKCNKLCIFSFFFCQIAWSFTFGYVMAGSTNTWQQTIQAAPPNEMMSAKVLSGHVIFETAFYDDDLFLCKNAIRIYYVWTRVQYDLSFSMNEWLGWYVWWCIILFVTPYISISPNVRSVVQSWVVGFFSKKNRENNK